jgi:hypothetical protein
MRVAPFALAALLASLPTAAVAADGPAGGRPAADGGTSPKRETPDYDGRPPPPASAGEAALWIPRVLLFPPYVVSEYVIRKPLGALVTVAERNNWANTLLDVFTFGPNHNGGIIPTAFFDFGLQPSVGLYLFWNDAFAKHNDLRAHVSYFFSDWLAFSASERFHVGKHSIMSLNGSWVRRPDYAYFGEGSRTEKGDRARYLAVILDVGPSWDLLAVPGVLWRARAGVRSVYFHDRGWNGDRSVFQGVADHIFPMPTDYTTGYTALYEHAELVLDSRPSLDDSQTGFRLVGRAEHGTDVRGNPASSWIRYGATAGAFADVWHHRTLGLTVAADFADPLRGGTIPFTEEVVWGGDEPLTGYIPGRLHGRSAAAATLEYTWPIWVWLEGRMSASVGNVFNAGLDDFQLKLLRASAGIGINSTGDRDHRLEVLFALGSETFDQGATVNSFRIVVGGTHGF